MKTIVSIVVVALLCVGMALAGIDPGVDTYVYGSTLPNNTGETAEGFIYRIDLLTPDEVVAVLPAISYPESEIGWIDFLNPLAIWWFGGSTALGETVHFSFVTSSPVVSATGEWLDDHDGLLVPLPPGFEVAPARWMFREEHGRSVLDMAIVNPTKQRVWVQRRINASRERISAGELGISDRLYLSGKPLDSAPAPISARDSLTHVEIFDPGMAGYFLAYELFSDEAGRPGSLIGTFSNAINVSLVLGTAGSKSTKDPRRSR